MFSFFEFVNGYCNNCLNCFIVINLMAGTVRISPDDLVDVLAKLAKDDNLQVSVKQSVKGGVIAGTGATVGGLLGGPIGIAVGASIGKYIFC